VTAELAKPPLDASVFQYGSGLSCCILRRENPTVLWGTDLVTDGTNKVSSATAFFLTNHVRIGDCLCVEAGSNAGEYLIDATYNVGSAATISSPVGGLSTVTGLSGMAASSVSGHLELTDGLNAGVYRIVSFLSATSVTIRHPAAIPESGVSWAERPRAYSFVEDEVTLKNFDGTFAILSPGAAQRFRVVRPFLHRPEVERMRYLFVSEHVIQGAYGAAYGIGLSSEWRDIFTPGMVGLPVRVSDSLDPVNNGEFIITKYINTGRVAIDNPSVVSEPAPGSQRINFLRAP
jgi:hypothetical protein